MSYDRAITIFSPDGKLNQIDYAMEAVKRGYTAIGIVGKDCVVLCVEKQATPKLQESRIIRKILRVDQKICLTFAGLQADSRVLVNKTRVECQSYRLNCEDAPTVDYVARYIADIQQQYTYRGGARPFGLSVLLAGFDGKGRPRLFQTDPAGTYYGWRAHAIGRNGKTVSDYLEKKYKDGMSVDDVKKLGIKALLEVVQGATDNIEVMIVDKDGTKFMPEEELGPLISQLDQTADRIAAAAAASR